MMDLRYHLASLMSIFLALAVGIVVGISLGSSERQAATIRLLQQDVAAIRAEDSRLKEANNDLQRRLARHEEAVQQDLLPVAIRGRLSGNRVAVVLVGDTAAELRAPITRALRLAGADFLVLHLPRGESASEGTSASSTRSGGGRSDPHTPSAAPAEETAGRVDDSAGLLARALLAGRPALLDEARARIPEMDVNGELRAPIRRLLLICPNDQPGYARLVADGGGPEAVFARSAQAEGAILVAAEPQTMGPTGHTPGAAGTAARQATSLLPSLAALGASTIDHVDTAMGQIAAVLALAGSHGNFGTGPDATRILPVIEAGNDRQSTLHSSTSTSHP